MVLRTSSFASALLLAATLCSAAASHARLHPRPGGGRGGCFLSCIRPGIESDQTAGQLRVPEEGAADGESIGPQPGITDGMLPSRSMPWGLAPDPSHFVRLWTGWAPFQREEDVEGKCELEVMVPFLPPLSHGRIWGAACSFIL